MRKFDKEYHDALSATLTEWLDPADDVFNSLDDVSSDAKLHKLYQREQFLGIDLATGKQMATHTWVACIETVNGRPTLSECSALKDLDSGRGVSLSPTLTLYNFILQHTQSLIGIDASFGIPSELLSENRWDAWINAFPSLYTDADAFRERCQQGSPLSEKGGSKELKRQTDVEQKTPFSPYNLRHYRQTYVTLNDILRPLVAGQKVDVLPMQTGTTNHSWVVETCPASLIKRALNVKKTPVYKGKTDPHRMQRERILDTLLETDGVYISPEYRVMILDQTGGDALDSVIMAWYLYHLWRVNPEVFSVGDSLRKHQPDSLYLREGMVF